ncbi:MAG: hypothetical protein JNK77_10190 [Saprospiraceae bacterium]|nr:hypothetical protein [Saprospiraceae bacterium]
MKKNLTRLIFLAAFWGVTAMAAWAQPFNCISGTVFRDDDNNGVQGPTESGIPGLTVSAINSAGALLQQMTGIDGTYQFCNLTPGQYFLIVQLNNPNLASTPTTQTVILEPDGEVTGVNFAIVDMTTLGTIAGTAYYDLNGNGIQDPFEPAIVGAQITLDGPNGAQTTQTDGLGGYRFSGLPAGDYAVTINANFPNTFWFTGPVLVTALGVGQLIPNLDFINRPNMGFGALVDFVCFDFNSDGINDPATEPGIGNFVIELFNSQGVLLDSALTDGNGRYGFIGLPPGVYSVVVVYDPAEYSPTTPTSYNADLPPNAFSQPGPFYFRPEQKRFRCGMALNSFGADNGATPGVVLSLRDIRNRTGAPQGVNLSWAAPYYTHPDWNSGRMGYIFGLAIDGDFNAYATRAATATYWSSPPIVNGNGIVFLINAFTGGVTNFVTASAAPTVVGGTTLFNNNSGLGNITYNKTHQLLYVTNRADQTINVIAAADNTSFAPGTILQIFDPAFAGQAGTAQNVYGIGFNPVENRLYFARDPSSVNAEIYSIAVNAGTGLIVGTEFFEFQVRDKPVPDIAFAGDGVRMLIAERLGAHANFVFQYSGSTGAWPPSQSIFVGAGLSNTNAAGGVDYAYTSFTGNAPPADGCDTEIIATGDALVFGGSSQIAYGMAIIPASGNTAGSYASLNSIFIDSDNDVTGQFYVKGLIGDVEVFDCECSSGCESLGLTVTPTQVQPDTACCWSLDYANIGNQPVFGIQVQALNGITFANGYNTAAGLFTPNFNSTSVTITPTGFGPMPAQVIDMIDFCLENVLATPQYIVINYLNGEYESFCSDTLLLDCMPEQACLYIVSDSLVCDSLGYKYIATVANPSGGFPVGFIQFNIQNPPPGVTFVPSPPAYVLTDTLYPGEQMMLIFLIQTNTDLYGDSLCFVLSAHDGIEERLCCAEIDTCIAFPLCDPCPYLDASVEPVDSLQADECCFTLFLTDTLTVFPNLITGLQVNILNPGINFSGWNTLQALLNGWTYTPPGPTNSFNWQHNSGLVPNGVNYPLFDFCVEGTTTTDSIYIEINWISGGAGTAPEVICTDTIAVYCPSCLAVVNDTLQCITNADGSQDYVYTFQFENYSSFLVNAVGIVEQPSSNTNVSPDLININPVLPYNPGPPAMVDTSDPISILIDGSQTGQICIDIVLRQIVGDSIDITCCYVTHCFELPPCDSLGEFLCPDPSQVSNDPCVQIFNPVCGCDGVTYSNACVAQNNGVLLWTLGLCIGDTLLGPVDDIQLEAFEHQGGGVDLSWSLTAAGEIDHFFVLRSIPGSVLKTIGTIEAVPGQRVYPYLDSNPAFGLNEYQVIGVDAQGRIVYSNREEIFVQWNQLEEINVSVFPVPAQQYIQIASSKQGVCTVELISPDGRSLLLKDLTFNGLPETLDISGLPESVIYIDLQYADGGRARQRFVKVE